VARTWSAAAKASGGGGFRRRRHRAAEASGGEDPARDAASGKSWVSRGIFRARARSGGPVSLRATGPHRDPSTGRSLRARARTVRAWRARRRAPRRRCRGPKWVGNSRNDAASAMSGRAACRGRAAGRGDGGGSALDGHSEDGGDRPGLHGTRSGAGEGAGVRAEGPIALSVAGRSQFSTVGAGTVAGAKLARWSRTTQ